MTTNENSIFESIASAVNPQEKSIFDLVADIGEFAGVPNARENILSLRVRLEPKSVPDNIASLNEWYDSRNRIPTEEELDAAWDWYQDQPWAQLDVYRQFTQAIQSAGQHIAEAQFEEVISEPVRSVELITKEQCEARMWEGFEQEFGPLYGTKAEALASAEIYSRAISYRMAA